MKILINWEVEDGYVGKGRPQETEIDVDKEEWEEMTKDQQQDLLDESVQEDFSQKISYGISSVDIQSNEER
jgi:hypothetical protein